METITQLAAGVSLITSLARLNDLLPPTTCRQCAGNRTVQAMEEFNCELCAGAGNRRSRHPNAPPEALIKCEVCDGTGKKQRPKSVVCPNCAGAGTQRRAPRQWPSTLDLIKTGDYVRIAIEFPHETMASQLARAGLEQSQIPADAYQASRGADVITCLVIGMPNPALVRVRIMQIPEATALHNLRYGDTILITPAHVIEHTQTPQETLVTMRNAGLLNTSPATLPTVEPRPGTSYFVRQGDRAEIWSTRTDPQTGSFVAVGRIDGGPAECEWFMSGKEKTGRTQYDLVQFENVVNT